MSRALRGFNFDNADANLPDGITLKTLQDDYGIKLTRHEDFAMKKVYYVPSSIHGNLSHIGAVSRYKFIIEQIPNQIELIIKNFVRPVPRYILNTVTD